METYLLVNSGEGQKIGQEGGFKANVETFHGGGPADLAIQIQRLGRQVARRNTGNVEQKSSSAM